MTMQWTNRDLVRLLGVDLVTRNEPNYAWGQACASILALPALRAFWPLSSVDYTTADRARDIAGAGYHLTDNNTVTFGYDQLAPYAALDGINQYLSKADGGAANWADIIGTESYIVAAQRGLTLGGWFYFDNAAGANEHLLGKVNVTVGNQRSYRLIRLGTGFVRFEMSVDGTAITTAPIAGPGAGVWCFFAGRFDPSTEVKVWYNDVTATNVAAIPATIFDSIAQFTIGARDGPSQFLDGRASLCWLCAAALSDSLITALFQQTRKLYNV